MDTTLSRRLYFLFGAGAVVIVLSLASFASALSLTRYLEFGMSGSDVSALQTFLAADPTIYPEGLVTGYFGNLTRAAVIRFQQQYRVPPTGFVGPLTRAKINQLLNGR